jgi:hypothetical protein
MTLCVTVVAPAVGTVLFRTGFVGVPNTKGGVSVQLGTNAPNDVTELVALGTRRLFTTVQVAVTVAVCPMAAFWADGAAFSPITDATAPVGDSVRTATSSTLNVRERGDSALSVFVSGLSVDRMAIGSPHRCSVADYRLGAQETPILKKT